MTPKNLRGSGKSADAAYYRKLRSDFREHRTGSDRPDLALFECEECGQEWPCATVAVLDAVSVDATPPQGIDRIEVEAALDDLLEEGEGTIATWRLQRYVDRILALVRPVQGVTLTPEDRDRVTGWFVKLGEAPCEVLPEDRALFARLEASS